MVVIESQSPQEPVHNTETEEKKDNNARIKHILSAIGGAVAGVVLGGRLATKITPNDKIIVDPEKQQVTANFEFDHTSGSDSYDVTIRKEGNTYMGLIKDGVLKKKEVFKCQDCDLDNLFDSLNNKMHQLNGQVKNGSEDAQQAKFDELKKYSKAL